MSQANKINMRDLPKTELKNSMERIHGVLPKRQITDNMLRNRDLYKTYMKSPINPLSLYQCFDGVGQLSSAPVADPTSDQAVAASK
ncbi:Histone transcription regulator 3, partial [Cryomyces antarcticus]